MKNAVITFGRMNPPTVGHQKLVDKVKSVARQNKAMPHVYLSHTQNKKKDPLDYDTKIGLATKAFGSLVTKSSARTIIEVMKELQRMGHTDIILVVGSDRVSEFDTLLNKYNGKEYEFNSIKVVSAGQRDPDAEGVAGMSASKMRALAMEGNFNEFKTGLPRALQSSAKQIYDKLRGIMEGSDDQELDEARVLTLQQRQKRARQMRRLARRLARKRAIRKTRMADKPRLEKRARKRAIEFLRKRVAGSRGAEYRALSPAEKISVDKLVQKRSASIEKLAKRLLPKVRKAEVERLRQARSSKNEEVLARKAEQSGLSIELIREEYYNAILNYDETKSGNEYQQAFQAVNSFIADNKDLNEMLRKEGEKYVLYSKDGSKKLGTFDTKGEALRRERQIQYFKHQGEEVELDELGPKTLANYLGKRFRQANKVGGESLPSKKSPETYLKNVDRASSRLMQTAEEGLKDACWKGYEAIGTKKKDGKEVPNCVPVKEEAMKLSELGAQTLIRYASAAASDAAAARKAGDTDRAKKRETGIAKAMDKEVASRTAPKPRPVEEDMQKKNLKSILSKKKDAKSTAGAGEWGTDKLTQTYVNDTPGQSIHKWEPGYSHFQETFSSLMAKKNLNEAVDSKKLIILARLGLVDDVTTFRRIMKKMEEEKALTPQEREVIYAAFAKFADLVTNDPMMFQKARKAVKEEVELDEAPLVLRGRADANQTMLKMVQTYISNASDSDLQKLAKMIGKKITIQGKKVVIEGFAEEDLAELSTDLLTRYKKKAADDASAADKKGDYAKGNKRFSGIMKATKKQFDNETKEAVATEWSKSRMNEDLEKFLEDADRTLDRLRWADVPQMEPLKRMSNDQLKGYVRDYVSKNKDQVSKFMGAADSGLLRPFIQKMAPKYIPATQSMSDKDWDNAWKAYDNIDSKIKSNLKKGDTSDFQTNQYVKEDGYKWKDFSDVERADIQRGWDRIGGSGVHQTPKAFDSGSLENRKKLADILRKPQKASDFEPIARTTPAERQAMNNSYSMEIHCPETGELVESLIIEEAEYEGKKVKLNDPFRLPAGSKKKFGVYVRNDKGNIVKVTFGDPNMEIKRDDPDRRAAYRSRHGCDNPGPKWKANYWSCYQWRAGKKVDN